MSVEDAFPVVRRKDGSIDIDFYARRAARLHLTTRAELAAGISAALGRVRARLRTPPGHLAPIPHFTRARGQ